MSMYDQSYNDGYPEQVVASVYESPNFTEAVDLGPAMPLSSGPGFHPAPHGVLLIFFFAIGILLFLGFFFRTHNLG